MSQDVVADALNMIMNAKKAGINEVTVKKYSKVLINVLELAKKHNYLDYSLDKEKKILKISARELNNCNAVKPRYDAAVSELDRFIRRFLPARGIGILIISTSKGLLTQEEAYEKNIGGSLIAYFY